MTSLLRAAIYCRVSTSGQEDNYSLPSQLANCRKYAQQEGYHVSDVRIYQDVASGFSLDNRPGLDRLCKALRAGDIDVVIVNSYDRLASANRDMYRLYGDLEEGGAALVSFTQGEFQNTAIGRAIVYMWTTGRELWLEDHKERTQRGLTARIAANRMLAGGKPIYGYRWYDPVPPAENPKAPCKTRLEKYEPEAIIVRRIFRNLAEGGSAAYMTRTLNAEGVPSPKGSSWCASTIGRLVRNQAYEGKAYARKWNCSPVKNKKTGKKYLGQALKPESERILLPAGTIPAIVDEETAARARHILATNHERLPTAAAINPEDFLLRGGIIRCGICGKAMTGAHTKTRGKTRTVYRCQAAYKGDFIPHHKSPQIEQSLIDRLAWDHALQVRTNSAYVRQHIEQLTADDTIGPELASIEIALVALTREAGNLSKWIAKADDEVMAAPLMAELKSKTKSMQELQGKRNELLSQKASRDFMLAALDDFEARVQRDISRYDREVMSHQQLADLASIGIEVPPPLTYAERRAVLEGLGVTVKVWPTGPEYSQRYEVIMAFDISDWQDPAWITAQDAADDTGAGKGWAPVYQIGTPELHKGTSRRSARTCSRIAWGKRE